jgi:hypothetical protein
MFRLARMDFLVPFSVVESLQVTSHFRKAADSVTPGFTRSVASSAVRWATPLTSTTTTGAPQLNSLMESRPGQKPPTVASALQTAKNFVSTTTLPVRTPPVPIPRVHEHTSVLSAAPRPITRSPGSVVRDLCRRSPPAPGIDNFLSITDSQFLPYRDFSSTIVHRVSLNTACKDFSEQFQNIFLSIIHPYDTDAFNFFISKHDLTPFYSLLVTNLRNGFPLGHMPPLIDTVIFKNHPSTLIHSDVVRKYLTDELDAGRMSGPFTLQQVERILHGAVFCSPLLISVQTQQPGIPDKLRVCRHLSKGDKNIPSTNSHIHKEDFPTRFDTASRVADIVGLFFRLATSISSLLRVHLDGSLMVSPLVAYYFTSFTSGGSLLHGFTSGGLLLHELHLWWLASSRASPLVARCSMSFTSGGLFSQGPFPGLTL